MKKLFAIPAIFIFIGVLAFSFNSTEKQETDKKKSECTSVATASDCGSGINAVLTSGTEKSSDCDVSHEAIRAVSAEKSSDCSSKTGSSPATPAAIASGDCSSEKTDKERIAEIN